MAKVPRLQRYPATATGHEQATETAVQSGITEGKDTKNNDTVRKDVDSSNKELAMDDEADRET